MKRSEISCMRKFRFARTKNELATKFVVGLGRVRENFVVYWREKLEAMRRYEGGKTWEGKKIMDMGE